MNVFSANPVKSSHRNSVSSRSQSELAVYSRQDQFIYVSLIFLASFTILLARWLRPSPSGVGTHEQLGLPSCFFLKLTGIPCPSCGLTTSFAHTARLHLYQALLTQPFGLIAFCLTILSIPLFVFLIRRRIAWSTAIHARGVDALLYLLIAVYLLSWFYKIAVMKLLPAA